MKLTDQEQKEFYVKLGYAVDKMEISKEMTDLVLLAYNTALNETFSSDDDALAIKLKNAFLDEFERIFVLKGFFLT